MKLSEITLLPHSTDTMRRRDSEINRNVWDNPKKNHFLVARTNILDKSQDNRTRRSPDRLLSRGISFQQFPAARPAKSWTFYCFDAFYTWCYHCLKVSCHFRSQIEKQSSVYHSHLTSKGEQLTKSVTQVGYVLETLQDSEAVDCLIVSSCYTSLSLWCLSLCLD